jgi:hypothetical protein
MKMPESRLHARVKTFGNAGYGRPFGDSLFRFVSQGRYAFGVFSCRAIAQTAVCVQSIMGFHFPATNIAFRSG